MIDKLMIWSSNSWSRYGQNISGNVTLRIYYDQLLLTTDNKIIESFNMNNKMKGVYKGDVLILIVSTNQQMRKLKFQIKTNAAQCLAKLGEHFPIVSHDKLPENTISPKFRQIEEIFKEALTVNNDLGLVASLPIPPDYETFIKLCLLDPSFPRLVSETEKIITSNPK